VPKWLHDKLARAGRKAGLSGDRLDAYIYSTLRKYRKRKARKSKRQGRRLARP
jgi:hypothetical protein